MKNILALILVLLCGCNEPRETPVASKVDRGNALNETGITYKFEGLTETEQGCFMRAFEHWNAVLGNRFQLAETDGTPTVLIGKRLMSAQTLGISYPGHIEINSMYTFHAGKPFGKTGLDIDLDGLALHEVGHTLGLKHLAMPNCMFKELHDEAHFLHDGDKKAIKELYGK